MKVWGIIATILLITSLAGNGWLYNRAEDSDSKRYQVEAEYQELRVDHEGLIQDYDALYKQRELCRESSLKLENEIETLESENRNLKDVCRAYDEYVTRLEKEAETARKTGDWESLLEAVFSIIRRIL